MAFSNTTTFKTDLIPGVNGSKMGSEGHAVIHNNLGDVLNRIQEKVGVDNSGDTASLDYKISNTSSSNPGHKHTLSTGATDVSATAAELNVLSGIPATLTSTELGYVDGVTSDIQTQLNSKASSTDLSTHASSTETHGATGAVVGTTNTQDLSNKTLIAPEIDTINGTLYDNPVIEILEGASAAVNYVAVQNAQTGSNPQVLAKGSDSNVTLTLGAKGLGGIKFSSGNGSNGEMLILSNSSATPANEITITNSVTTGTPSIAATGDDSNISLNLISKGSGVIKANNIELVTLSGSQILTNKTLTSPSITTPTGIVKGDIGLGNVDNTSDADKPVSTAQQTALNLKANLASPTFTGTVVLPANQSLTTPTVSDLTNMTHTHANAAGGGTLTESAISTSTGFGKNGLLANAIYNGKMEIWQMGSGTRTLTHLTITADRFVWGQQAGTSVFTCARSTDAPDSTVNYSMLISCTTSQASVSAGDERHIRYAIEGSDFTAYKGQAATLSFWVKSNKTGTYSVAFTNSGRDRTYIAEYTINASNTWEQKTINITFNETGGTWDYTNGQGIGIRFCLMAGSTYQGTVGVWNVANVVGSANQVNFGDSNTNTFRLAKVQLNFGTTALAYYQRPFIEDYLLCQRYLKVFEDQHIRRIGPSAVATAAVVEMYVPLQVRMRIVPAVTLNGTRGTDWILRSASDVDNATGTLEAAPSYGRDFGLVRFATGTYTAGLSYHVLLATSSGGLVFNAEI